MEIDEYTKKIKKALLGKKIKEIHIDGYGIEIITEDNLRFEYNATDGGYSSYGVEKIGE